jgi:RsiW-degrading membrane proteinase PrsW (M82 family)
LWRIPERKDPPAWVLGTFIFGMLAAWVGAEMEHVLAHFMGVGETITLGSKTSLIFVFLFSSPLEESLKVAAAWPAFRSSYFDEEFDGILYAGAAGLGFAVSEAALGLSTHGTSSANLLRVFTMMLAQPLLASFWGYELGRVRKTKVPTSRFTLVWIASIVLHGLLEHLSAARSALGIVSAAALLFAMGIAALWAGRALLDRYGVQSVRRARSSVIPPPSLHAMRLALHRSQKPVLFHWIPLGALTTSGVMLTTVTVCIWLGHRSGLDFSAIDQAQSSPAATAPLALIAFAVLAAFPISGYLIAKASGSDGVLEPALSSAVAIVTVLALLTLAAPVALVLALAFAPIAFGLACAGAWVGLGR